MRMLEICWRQVEDVLEGKADTTRDLLGVTFRLIVAFACFDKKSTGSIGKPTHLRASWLKETGIKDGVLLAHASSA